MGIQGTMHDIFQFQIPQISPPTTSASHQKRKKKPKKKKKKLRRRRSHVDNGSH